MSKHNHPRDDSAKDSSDSPDFAFDPVIVRARHDGWTAERQVAFIQALAEYGCVVEACARVGMSTAAAYGLRARLDAQGFRYAWDAALDHAVRRLSDAALGRAINGVPRPVFYQGEQIGERRYYDERLTQFLLRYRDPNRYGRWNDTVTAEPGHADSAALALAQCLLRVLKDGHAFDGGDPAPSHPPYDPARRPSEDAFALAEESLRRSERMARGDRAGGPGIDTRIDGGIDTRIDARIEERQG